MAANYYRNEKYINQNDLFYLVNDLILQTKYFEDDNFYSCRDKKFVVVEFRCKPFCQVINKQHQLSRQIFPDNLKKINC